MSDLDSGQTTDVQPQTTDVGPVEQAPAAPIEQAAQIPQQGPLKTAPVQEVSAPWMNMGHEDVLKEILGEHFDNLWEEWKDSDDVKNLEDLWTDLKNDKDFKGDPRQLIQNALQVQAMKWGGTLSESQYMENNKQEFYGLAKEHYGEKNWQTALKTVGGLLNQEQQEFISQLPAEDGIEIIKLIDNIKGNFEKKYAVPLNQTKLSEKDMARQRMTYQEEYDRNFKALMGNDLRPEVRAKVLERNIELAKFI
jgi:hypothetical protein